MSGVGRERTMDAYAGRPHGRPTFTRTSNRWRHEPVSVGRGSSGFLAEVVSAPRRLVRPKAIAADSSSRRGREQCSLPRRLPSVSQGRWVSTNTAGFPQDPSPPPNFPVKSLHSSLRAFSCSAFRSDGRRRVQPPTAPTLAWSFYCSVLDQRTGRCCRGVGRCTPHL